MLRDEVLQTPVRLSPEQIDLAARAIHSMGGQDTILVRLEDDLVDWFATAQRVLDAAINVYFSLLLIQAKREQRGILAETAELACHRKEALTCLNQICGKAITVSEVLSVVAAQSGMEERDLRLLSEPIRRDLARLQTHEPRANAKSAKRSSSRR